jgi:mono/diheme cytochrome c family protein
MISSLFASLNSGEKVFRAYCWGCHHQTSMAFGPSFKQIANSRTKTQMITHISAPKSDFKELGYKRTVMPSFGTTLNKKELDLIIDFIIKQKDSK